MIQIQSAIDRSTDFAATRVIKQYFFFWLVLIARVEICSVISQICEDLAMILPRSSERSAGSISGTAANVVAFGRGDLGTRVRFVALVLVTI